MLLPTPLRGKMHTMRRSYALALSVVLATVEGVLSVTFPVEMVLTLPIPEMELLIQADKIQRAVALAADVDESLVSLSHSRALTTLSSSAHVLVSFASRLTASAIRASSRLQGCVRLGVNTWIKAFTLSASTCYCRSRLRTEQRRWE